MLIHAHSYLSLLAFLYRNVLKMNTLHLSLNCRHAYIPCLGLAQSAAISESGEHM